MNKFCPICVTHDACEENQLCSRHWRFGTNPPHVDEANEAIYAQMKASIEEKTTEGEGPVTPEYESKLIKTIWGTGPLDKPSCVFLTDGTKISIGRDGMSAWLIFDKAATVHTVGTHLIPNTEAATVAKPKSEGI